MSQPNTTSSRIVFARPPFTIQDTDLLCLQLGSFEKLFTPDAGKEQKRREKLFKIFQENFPISDLKENFVFEFLDYHIGVPYNTPAECLDQGITYDVPLKVTFRLTCKEADQESKLVEEEVFIANLPYMTPQGSFIINGIERVLISQLQRSYGVFFSKTKHSSGADLYAAKIVPTRGSWIEFSVDVNHVMYAYIDRRKKIPVTLMLRAIGYSTDKEILDLFGLCEEVKVSKRELEKHIGKKLAGNIVKKWIEEFVDEETGEVISIDRSEILVGRGTTIDADSIAKVLETEQKTIVLYKETEENQQYQFIYNTLEIDESNDRKEAIEQIYLLLYNTEPPDMETAEHNVLQIFFSDKRSFMGPIGRYCLNKKLGLNIPADVHVLTKEDLIEIIKKFGDLIQGEIASEDPDSMANRILQLPGDQVAYIFERGVKLIARSAKDTLNSRSNEELTPSDLINAHPFSSSVNTFFGTNSNSQFMDQVNPLSELSQKQRLTKLSPTGLTKERAGFEARDIHYTHFGRLCVVQSPEGLGIGLTPTLAIHAVVNEMGFIQTPYKKVINGKVDLSGAVHYLTAGEEEEYAIAQITSKIAPDGTLLTPQVKARVNQGGFITVPPQEVDYMDAAYDQIVSISAALIPFLENNDASRALMGANYQRQAVPLLQSEAPIVGTGKEVQAVRDSRVIPSAKGAGVVTYVDARKIVIKYELPEELANLSLHSPEETVFLSKMLATNQGTCLNLRPIVQKGERVTKDQWLCEGYATKAGELSLGKNVRVAFMSYQGYNFEDGIVISERLVKEDIFTSIHIEELKLDAYQTKLGPEEFTADIPNISEEAMQNLDENGIIRVGKEVKEGDILVGKITPQTEANLSPENKLFQAIFGDKFSSVKDTSLRVPSSLKGTVIKTKLSSSPIKSKAKLNKMEEELKTLKKNANQELSRLAEKGVEILSLLLDKKASTGIYDINKNELVPPKKVLTKKLIEEQLFVGTKKNKELEHDLYPAHLENYSWTNDSALNDKISFFFSSYHKQRNEIISTYKQNKKKLEVGDDLPLGVIKQAKVWVAKKEKLKVGDKLSGRHGNKGIVTKIAREEDMPYDEHGQPVDIILNQHGIPGRMNLGQILEALLGWPGLLLDEKYAVPLFQGGGLQFVQEKLAEAQLPEFGRTTLYDGLSGEKFDHKVTCGVIYMLKLNHLVTDKIAYRSTDGYVYINQQPLGGRSRKGGQRFGEMEVWALEAYGAAHELREMVTIKSDDVEGRQKAYEAIVKGNNLPKPGTPESFKVFWHQTRAAGLEITLRKPDKK